MRASMPFRRAPAIAAVCLVLCVALPSRTATQDRPPAPDPAAIALADALLAAPDVAARIALLDAAAQPARSGLRRELVTRSTASRLQQDYRRSLAIAEVAVWTMTRLGDREGLSAALVVRGIAQAETGDIPGARTSMNLSLAECEAIADKACAARVINNSGILFRRT